MVGATLPLWIPASARMTNSVVGDNYFRTNRPCRLRPAHQSMKNRSCGLVPGIGTVDSATPHPDPCGGQAPALHFPLPTPVLRPCIGVRACVSRDVQAEAGPAGGFAIRHATQGDSWSVFQILDCGGRKASPPCEGG